MPAAQLASGGAVTSTGTCTPRCESASSARVRMRPRHSSTSGRAEQLDRRLLVEQGEGGVEAAVVDHLLQARAQFGGARGIGAGDGAGRGEGGRRLCDADEARRREVAARPWARRITASL